jgi:hypothetical protein
MRRSRSEKQSFAEVLTEQIMSGRVQECVQWLLCRDQAQSGSPGPLETELLVQADKLVGGSDAVLVIVRHRGDG